MNGLSNEICLCPLPRDFDGAKAQVAVWKEEQEAETWTPGGQSQGHKTLFSLFRKTNSSSIIGGVSKRLLLPDSMHQNAHLHYYGTSATNAQCKFNYKEVSDEPKSKSIPPNN